MLARRDDQIDEYYEQIIRQMGYTREGPGEK